MKGTKIVKVLLLIVIVSFSVSFFLHNAFIEEIKAVDSSKNNKLLEVKDEL